jgi:ribosome recycling factor
MLIPKLKTRKEGTSEDVCKDAEEEVQTLLTALSKVEELLVVKEAEIMKVLLMFKL